MKSFIYQTHQACPTYRNCEKRQREQEKSPWTFNNELYIVTTCARCGKRIKSWVKCILLAWAWSCQGPQFLGLMKVVRSFPGQTQGKGKAFPGLSTGIISICTVHQCTLLLDEGRLLFYRHMKRRFSNQPPLSVVYNRPASSLAED